MTETPIQCQHCGSLAIIRFRIDCDWGDGGDVYALNSINSTAYTDEQQEMIRNGERPDIEINICLSCELVSNP